MYSAGQSSTLYSPKCLEGTSLLKNASLVSNRLGRSRKSAELRSNTPSYHWRYLWVEQPGWGVKNGTVRSSRIS